MVLEELRVHLKSSLARVTRHWDQWWLYQNLILDEDAQQPSLSDQSYFISPKWFAIAKANDPSNEVGE